MRKINIAIIQDKNQPAVNVYCHWMHLDEAVQRINRAIDSARDRWDDPSYLTRSIFSRIIEDDVHGTTGFGLSAVNQVDIEAELIIDIPNQTIHSNEDAFSMTFSEMLGY